MAIYVNNNLKHELVDEFTYIKENCMESICINVTLKCGKRFKVFSIYRPPDIDMKLFNDEIEIIIECTKSNRVFMCGDLNINLLKYEDHCDSKEFINSLFSHGLYPLINLPTRITSTSSTLIDNIFTNEIDVDISSGILINDISDHLPIFSMIKYESKVGKSNNYNYKFVIDK